MTTNQEPGDWKSSEIKYYKTVSDIQKQIRKGNWTYLCRHPEIRAIIRVILQYAINNDPADVVKSIAEFFDCCKTPMLTLMINEQLKRVNDQLKRGRWSQFDGEMFFTESSASTHSLLSNMSTTDNVQPVMAYALVLNEAEQCDP